MTRENRIKKLIYRSWYRGCRETDKILGGYAKDNLHKLSEMELDLFEEILDYADNDIFDWVSGKQPVPEHARQNKIFTEVLNYKPHNNF
jgi:antitoxin CptB